MVTGWGAVRTSSAVLAAVTFVFVALGTGYAQSARDAVFQQLLRDPANPTLMLEFARLSVAEQDYEAAISTLERLVDLDPQNQEARLELALAYFALGQNDVAQYHLDIYLTRGDLTDAQRQEATAYVDAVEDRGSGVKVAAKAEAGIFARSLEDDIGLKFQVDVSLDADIGVRNTVRWDTDIQLTSLTFPDTPADDLLGFKVRTGPVLSIDGKAFGAQLRPYLEYHLVDTDADDDAGESFSFGFEFTNIIDANWTVDADLQYGQVFRSGTGFDSDFTALRIGAQYRATQQTGFRAALRYLDEDEDPGGTDLIRKGILFGGSHDVSGPFLGIGQSWSVSAYSRFDRDNYSTGREDDVLGYGVSLMTNLNDTTFLRAGVRKFDRTSSDPAFDEDNTIISLEAGVEF